MMQKFAYFSLFLFVGLISAGLISSAQARNAEVEASLQKFNDLTDFYQALISTGVADELRPGQPYTVLAPTNKAFSQLIQNYPCFYQERCRDLSASFIRAHIIVGRAPIQWMVQNGRSETEGHQWVSAKEPFKNEYTVNGTNVLSVGEIGSDLIYRLDGFVVPQRNLAIFQSAQLDNTSDIVITRTTTTYLEPVKDTGHPSRPVIQAVMSHDKTTVETPLVTEVDAPTTVSWY